MTKWEQLEQWLFDKHTFGGGGFTNRDVVDGLSVTGAQATAMIRSYENAQRATRSRTLYVLHREGRTSRAIWKVGIRATDARAISHQFSSDVAQRWKRAVEPDLRQIGARNPDAAKRCEAIIDAVAEGALRLLRVAVGDLDDTEDDSNAA